MILIVAVVIFIIVAYIGYIFYQFDNSPFAKQYGYSLINTLTNSKVATKKAIYDGVYQSSADAQIIYDLSLPNGEQTVAIDCIIVHPSGVYVATIPHKKGWISGSYRAQAWIEQLHGDKKNSFTNPIHQSMRGQFILSDIIPEIDKQTIEPVVIFSNSCSFLAIDLNDCDVEVLKAKDTKKWASSLGGQSYTKEQIKQIAEKLKAFKNN